MVSSRAISQLLNLFNGLRSLKGQIWSTDFAISVTIFSLVIFMFYGLYQQIQVRYDNWYDYQLIQYHAHLFSNQLIMTPGDPANWEELSVNASTSIGLAPERNVLSNEKLTLFFNSTWYDTIRDKNHLPYQFVVNITNLEGNETWYLMGNDSQSNISAPVQRLVLINDTPAWLYVKVWE